MVSESRGQYLIKNTFIFTIGSIATKLIMFILVPIYTHILTTQEYGVVDLISTISMVLAPVIILNIGESVMRFSLDKGADHNQIMSSGLMILIIAIFGGLLIIPVAKCFVNLGEYSLFLYLYTISSAGSQLLLCYLRGKEQLIQYICGNIINTFGVAGLNILFLVVLKKGIMGYLLAYIIASVVTIIYAFFVGNVLDVIRNFKINKRLTSEMLKYSLVLVPNIFMWWIMNSADRIVITAIIGVEANGIFAIAYKIPSLIVTVVGIFNQSWSYSAIREEESEDKENYTNNVYKGFFMIISLLALGMLMILKPFMRVYVNAAYYSAWRYVPYLIIGFVFQTLGTFLSTSYTVNKDSKGFLFSATFGAVINIILNFLLVFKWELTGVAIATSVSYMAVFFYRVIDTKKYIKIDVFNKKHLTIMAVLIMQAITVYSEKKFSYALLLLFFLLGIVLQREIWYPQYKRLIRKVKYTERG